MPRHRLAPSIAPAARAYRQNTETTHEPVDAYFLLAHVELPTHRIGRLRLCRGPLSQGQAFADEIKLCKKDGSIVVCDVRSKAIDPAQPHKGSVWITMDITERQEAQAALQRMHHELESVVQQRTHELSETVKNLHQEIKNRRQDQERLHWLAHYDALTGLPNRTLLAERSRQAIEMAQKNYSPLAVMPFT